MEVLVLITSFKNRCLTLFCLLAVFINHNSAFACPLKPTPGLATIKNLLCTSLLPVGKTMYIWGGGWNEEDTASGKGSTHIGVLPGWENFSSKQDAGYNFLNYKYNINAGLDCSGFVGWAIYNVFNTQNEKDGYVMKSSIMANEFANRGFGKYKNKDEIIDYKPGDITSGPGHVLICIGQCEDGSVLFIHSSPPGVQINGTTTIDGNENSMAINLATHYMKKYYPEWPKKYPHFSRGNSYLTNFSQMRWSTDGSAALTDPDGYFDKSVSEILKNLFNE